MEAAIETFLAEMVVVEARSAEKFDKVFPGLNLEKGVCVGRQKFLGFLGYMWTKVYEAQVEGDQDRVRLLLAMGMAAMDQYALDENWTTAWRVTGLPQPPWASWSTMDISAKRSERPHSRLLQPNWMAALVGAMKDEEVLLKRRGGKGKGKDKDKEGDKKD